MPELPEVQTTVKGIQARTKGLIIEDVWTDYNSPHHVGNDNIKDPAYFTSFKKHVVGATITGASRRAKNVLTHLSNGFTILVHMKMTGHMMYGEYTKSKVAKKDFGRGLEWIGKHAGPLKDDPFNKFIHLVFTLSNGKHLVLSDMRKFAKVTLIKTSDLNESEHTGKSGPEPLDDAFTFEVLKKRLALKPTGPIKIVLMNHEIVSGIGNIYSDEILWRAGVHPLEKVKNVPDAKLKLIFKAIKETLKKGIALGGDSMSDYRNIDGMHGEFQDRHNAYQKNGQRCSKKGCNGTIVRLKIGGRSAHYCDTHQKLLKRG